MVVGPSMDDDLSLFDKRGVWSCGGDVGDSSIKTSLESRETSPMTMGTW